MKLQVLVSPVFQAVLDKLNLASEEGKIPLKGAFALKGAVKKISEEIKKYEEVRVAAMKQFGSKKENGDLEINEKGEVQFSPENFAPFSEQLGKLLETDILIEPIKVSDLGDKINLSIKELLVADGFIVT